MAAIDALHIVDLRGSLPRPLAIASATGRPQERRKQTLGAVLHFNGDTPPPARAGGDAAGIVGWVRDVIIPNHIRRIGADGVQYIYWIARDGTIYQLRDADMFLWHCGNYDKNAVTVPVHIPIGGAQQPTSAQWTSATNLFTALGSDYGFSRAAVLGHKECGASECPGEILMPMLRAWRGGAMLGFRYEVQVGGANVRSAPRRANNVLRVAPFGEILAVANENVPGEAVAGNATWCELMDGGYVHSSVVRRV